ncbi:MAG: HEAT repeat domain-containing protein [Planctomycetota bacterium]
MAHFSTIPGFSFIRPISGLGLALALLAGAAGCQNGALDPASAVASVFPQPPTPSEAVGMMFDRDDPDNRREGINWLSAAPFGGEEEYVKSYRLFYNDPDPSVRAACAQALGLHGNVEDANLLVVMLADEHAQVRWNAANGLRMIHHPPAIEALAALTSDQAEPDSDVRQAACDALGQYPEFAVFSALSRALEDRNYAVIAAAKKSLVTLTGHDAGYDPRDWADWSQQQGGNLFANQQVYTFAPYQKPRGWTDSVRFWREPDEVEPQRPTGYEVAGG